MIPHFKEISMIFIGDIIGDNISDIIGDMGDVGFIDIGDIDYTPPYVIGGYRMSLMSPIAN